MMGSFYRVAPTLRSKVFKGLTLSRIRVSSTSSAMPAADMADAMDVDKPASKASKMELGEATKAVGLIYPPPELRSKRPVC